MNPFTWEGLALIFGGGVVCGVVIFLVRLHLARKRARREVAALAPWWWEDIRCTCPHVPARHVLILATHDGRSIGTYEVLADEAHQLARRVFDQAFGFRSGEFVGMVRELEFTTFHGSIVMIDVLTVGSVEIAGHADRGYT